ncbi:hypothetical protein FHS57_005114 [Runella defluvii]|uniref:Uncharacterized protein n=1 Tax=Runella defluvii TaxID=370973 RepID=A0A7W6ESX5_9BACT|nr:hypothetical protein [Runella defluvii]MBB3841093.1 hypothetical protein [Runella defluvii]
MQKDKITITRKESRKILSKYSEELKEKEELVREMVENGGLTVDDELDEIISLCIQIKAISLKNDAFLEVWQEFINQPYIRDEIFT